MDVSSIITLSRKQTATSIWQITDEKYLESLNIVYRELFSKLATASKKYTRETYTTDVIKDQVEYVLPIRWWTKTGIKLVLDVFYKWEKIKIFDSDRRHFEEENGDKPTYWVVRDWSIFIYPRPTEDITAWLRVEWKYIPLDLSLTDTNDNIKLPVEYHNILVEWLNAAIFGEKQIYDKQQLWKWYYEMDIQNMIYEWGSENEDWYEDMEDPFGYYTSLNFMP